MLRFKVLFFVVFLTLMESCSSTAEMELDLYPELMISHKEQEVMNVVNEYRVSQGLNALEFNTVAYKFANEHNIYMISEGRISHDNFDIRSSNLAVKVNADYVSENLGKDFTYANDILRAWIASPTHLKVMKGEFAYTAVSVQADAEGVLYYTQLFYK